MASTTVTEAPILRPEQVHGLIVAPVDRASVAVAASTLVTTDSHEFRIPTVTADPAAAWTAEGDEISPSDIGTAALVVIPAKLAGLTVISREIAEDSSPAAAQVVGNGLARDIARKLDQAYFGTLPAPAPAGLESLAGPTQVDAPATFADLDPFAEAISEAEQVGATITSFVANPADALALAQLKTDSSSSNQPLLGSDPANPTRRQLLGVPLLTSPAVTAGTVWGLPRDLVFVVRRNDTRIEVSNEAYFSTDEVAIKATMRIAFGWPHSAAVVKVVNAAT